MGLLVLFALLGVLLCVSLPVIKAEGAVRVSDWLGFAGNVVGALFAMIAAGVAWVAAQRQIRHAAKQNAVVAYDSIRNVLSSINKDLMLIQAARVGMVGVETAAAVWSREPPETVEHFRVIVDMLNGYNKTIATALDELAQRRAESWGSSVDRATREEMLEVALTAMVFFKVNLIVWTDAETLPDVSDFRGMLLPDAFQQMIEATDKAEATAKNERNRLYEMADKHFSSFAVV